MSSICNKCNKPKGKEEGTCDCGRPTKLTERFIERAKEVIDHDINAIILTDEELLDEINEGLEEKERICKATFENWKSKNKEGKEGELNDLGREFLGLIKKALRQQKRNLFEKLKGDDKMWQRWAWILERKFDDWNIRHKQEHSGEINIKGNEIKVIPYGDKSKPER